MTKNSVYITLALVGLGVAFGVLSLLVWASRGHPGLIRHKLRIGAVIVSLTAILAGGAVGCSRDDGTSNCYAPVCYSHTGHGDASVAPPNEIKLENALNGTLEVDRQQSALVSGWVVHVHGETFSFRIVNDLEVLVQSGNIIARDGMYDEDTEPFDFMISTEIPAGEYRLLFYSVPVDQQESRPDQQIASFTLYLL